MRKIILIDGYSLMYRAYYGTAYTGNLMQNTKGLFTNAIYSFVKIINNLKDKDFDNILVAFDAGKKTFRHEFYPKYKDGRSPMPDEFRVQIPYIKQFLSLANIAQYELSMYEADDIIGTLAEQAKSAGYNVEIYSSDRDLLQLVDEKVTVQITKKGFSELVEYTPNSLLEQYGLTPEQFIDLKALMGDASDNIPGVPGIGEKTAVKLLASYSSLDNIIKNVDNIPGKIGASIKENIDNVLLYRKMCTIELSAPIDIRLMDTVRREPNEKELSDFYRYMDFFSLLKKAKTETKEPIVYKVISDVYSVKEVLLDNSYLVFESLGNNYHKDDLLALGIMNKKGYFIIIPEVIEQSMDLQFYLADENNKKVFDYKKGIVLLNRLGVKLSGVVYDMVLAAYLLHPEYPSDMYGLCQKLGYIELQDDASVYGSGVKQAVPLESIYYSHIASKLAALASLEEQILNELKTNEQLSLLTEMEIPVAKVLANMEIEGILIDKEELARQTVLLKTQASQTENKIYEYTGEFNISSHQQLGDVLFNKLMLPPVKKIKSGYSTDIDTLKILENEHPVIPLVIEYRQLTKLISTYLDGLQAQIFPDGKVHTIFLQTLTQTGRLSSIEPNIQNIPIRSDLGKEIRKLFVAKEGSVLLTVDYSQIEMRLLAHMAKVEKLLQAFHDNVDIHTTTAKAIFHVDLVTEELRRKAKAANFGIIYGMSGYGLSNSANISVQEANDFIRKYLNVYPEISAYMNEMSNNAKEKGYVETLYKRRRYIPEIKSPVFTLKELGKRTAMNAPIQGSAADIIKVAMINIEAKFKSKKLKSTMLLQVHDELVFNVLNNEREEVLRIVKKEMEEAVELLCPLAVEYGFGKNWLEAK